MPYNKDFKFEKKKRAYIRIDNLRIAPDAIAAYMPAETLGGKDCGLVIAFANGRYFEIATTEQEKERFLAYMDEIKNPVKL